MVVLLDARARNPARDVLHGEQGLNPSSRGINIVDAPLSGACHVLWGATGTLWGRAEGCTM